jgi:signal transduction histidine kinase
MPSWSTAEVAVEQPKWGRPGALVTGLLAGGRRTGSEPQPDWLTAERARILRTLHDTVLQDLEVMARDSELDRISPAEAVAQLRGTARSQAVRLRAVMAELLDGERPGTLAAGLTDVIAEYAAAGLRVEPVLAQDLPELTDERREAVCAAVRAALGNVVKHAGVARAVVRVACAGRGVEVVVRDNGVGFDSALRRPGFGVRQSIVARLCQVGGTATVESSPGLGTRVRLWVPR